jgi:hypothetical protein
VAGAEDGSTRRALFVNRPSGDGLSLVIGDDRSVAPVIALSRAPTGDPEEYEVRLLQVGAPTCSGVVDALFGRVVRCDATAIAAFARDAVPACPDVWARALLVAPERDTGVAVAVGSSSAALDDTLSTFTASSAAVDDYDDLGYFFFARD